MFTVVGIDTSMTGTGLCRLTIDGGVVDWETDLISTKGHRNDTLWTRRRRLGGIRDRVDQFVTLGGTCAAPCGHCAPDLIVIEGPSYASKGAGTHDRSGLWWLVVDQIIEVSTLMEITPGQRMKFATGKGNVDKDQVLAAAVRRFPGANIINNNVADAVILAAMGAMVAGEQVELSAPKYSLEVIETLVSARKSSK